MIKPIPITYTCQSCHWSKTVAPRSDALLGHDLPIEQCPKCGSNDIVSQKAGALAAATADIRNAISDVFGKRR